MTLKRKVVVLAVLLLAALVTAGVYLARSNQVVRSDWLPMFFEAPLSPQCYTYDTDGLVDRNCGEPHAELNAVSSDSVEIPPRAEYSKTPTNRY